MKSNISNGKIIFLAALFLSSVYLSAQDGSELITAVVYQDLDKIKEVLKAGVDVNYQDENYGNTALIISCQYNFVDIAKYLIEAGADISAKATTGHTPLMAAASASEELVDLLIAKGADATVKLEDGTSAFTLSITGILMDRIGFKNAKTLLEKGADVDEKQVSGEAEGYTCLMMAARNQRPDIVNFLVENGADVNAKAGNGDTPLSLAEKEGDQEMVALLKKYGAK